MKQSDYESVKIILKRAIDATILRDEFYSEWKKISEENEILKVIFEEVEEAVLHCPGFFFKKGVDYQTWTKDLQYGRLVCHDLLLPFAQKYKNVNWLSLRKDLLKEIEKDWKSIISASKSGEDYIAAEITQRLNKLISHRSDLAQPR
jgi:hypothetical protein